MAYKPKDTKERIHHRFKIASGHLKKVLQMLEDDQYCIDVIHQSQAVQRALKEANNLILENHLKTCVASAIKQGKSGEAVKEVMNVLKRSE
jgi:CsoR family transcriptional regulator, copper-sensing transcriptional repressor